MTRKRKAPLSALDVAMGSGRHAVPLAQAGFVTFGVDLDAGKVRAATEAARRCGVGLYAWVADLTQGTLPLARFDLIVCTRYLQRNLFGELEAALKPGGTLLFETFTTAQLRHGRGPQSPDHLLRPGELATAFPRLRTLAYEEVDAPDAVARLAARRESAS